MREAIRTRSLRGFFQRHPHTVWWAIAASCVIAAIATLVVTQNNNVERFARSNAAIIQANILGCQRANDTRDGVRALIDNQIAEQKKRARQSQNISAYRDLFPGISDERLHGLIDKQVAQIHQSINGLLKVRRKVRNAPCQKLYPRPL